VCITNGQLIQWFKVERTFDDNGKPQYSYQQESDRDDIKDSLFEALSANLGSMHVNIPSITVRGELIEATEYIGRGKTSTVFRCKNSVGNEFVLKYMPGGEGNDDEMLTLLSGVTGVPRLEGFEKSNVFIDGVPVLKTTHVLMSPVCSRLADCAELPLIVVEFVDILDRAHKVGVVHRDVRPDNMMVFKGQAYLVDWGYAVKIGFKGTYSGTFHFASDAVLQALSNATAVSAKPQYDLESLVKALLAVKNNSLLQQLMAIDSKPANASKVQKVWDTWFKPRPVWKAIYFHATKRQYDDVKRCLSELV